MTNRYVQISPEELEEIVTNAVNAAVAICCASIPPPAPAPSKESELITRYEAKALLKVKSIATIDNLVRNGTLKKYRLGTLVYLKRSEVIGFMNVKN
jgi:hypothetical protein